MKHFQLENILPCRHTHTSREYSLTGSVSGLINLPTDLGYYLRFAVQKINLNTSEYKKCLLKELI